MSLEKAKRKLSMWEEAEDAIAIGGQSYKTQGGREITRANLKEVRENIKYYERKVASLSGNFKRGRKVVFRDDL